MSVLRLTGTEKCILLGFLTIDYTFNDNEI